VHNPAPSRRDEILEIAAKVFARQGVNSTTVRDIADEAGILSGSLYHHFESKDQMVEDIIRPAIEADLDRYAELAKSELRPDESIPALFEIALSFIDRQPAVAAILANSFHQLRRIERFEFLNHYADSVRQAWSEVLRRGVTEGVFRNDLDVDMAYKAMMGSVTGVAGWYRPGGAYPMERIVQEIASLYVLGFCAAAAGGKSA
jgi:AcrR family transcriptional regulator